LKQNSQPNQLKSAEELRQEAIAEAKSLEKEILVKLNAVRVILESLEKREDFAARKKNARPT